MYGYSYMFSVFLMKVDYLCDVLFDWLVNIITTSPSTTATFRYWNGFRNILLFKNTKKTNDQSHFFRVADSVDLCQ